MLIGLIVGLTWITMPGVGWGLEYFPGDLGDGRFNLYLLEHAYHFFTGQTKDFWGAPFMYPEPDVISYSDNLLGSAPIYAVFRVFGLSEFTAYQLWYIVVSALNYTAAYGFLRYIFKNRYAAVMGAFVFAFSLALQSQFAHAQVFPRFAIPLALWAAVKFGEQFQPKYFLLALLLVVYQVYCGIYLGFLLMVPTALTLVLLAWKAWDKIAVKSKRMVWWIGMAVSTVIGLAVLMPLMLPYARRSAEVGPTPYHQVAQSLPTLSSYFFAKEGSLPWRALENLGKSNPVWWDFQLFAGGIATLCLVGSIIWVLWRWIKVKFDFSRLSITDVLFFGGTLTFFLFLRFGEDISAYFLLYLIPGFGAMRSLTRVINVELIFYGIATSWVFVQFLPQQRWGFLGFLVALGLLAMDNYLPDRYYYHSEVAKSQARTQPLEPIFASIPKGSVVSYEPAELIGPFIYYQFDAMLLAQRYGLIAINGYSATAPLGFDAYWLSINADMRNRWLSGKHLGFDTLYVVRSPRELVRVAKREIEESSFYELPKSPVERMMEEIRSDENWMELIRSKASDRGISVDSMVRIDAKWVLENS